MAYTPVELRHATFDRTLFGYSRPAVDRLLTDAVRSFEDVWRERAGLAERVEQLQNEIDRYRELESALHTTLVSAERASEEVRTQARRETEVILAEAHAEARAITRAALGERERLLAEARQVRALLRAALAALDDEELPALAEDAVAAQVAMT
jgi:cell division initiation protein